MTLFWNNFALIVIISCAFLHNVNSQIEWPGSAEAFGTPELYSLIANSSSIGHEHQNEIISILQNQQQTLSQMAQTHAQMSQIQAQMSQTQTQMLHMQTQIANALGHVVSLLQTQEQQQQNMTATMNTVVSVLNNHQETLENISHSLPAVLEQQANQIELLSQCQPKFKSNCSNIEFNRQQRPGESLSDPPATTQPKYETYETTALTTIKPAIRDCSDFVMNASNVYTITSRNGSSFDVYCDMNTAGGGWTVFQKRFNGAVDFNRTWDEYEEGFGSLDGEFWLGLHKIHQLTQSGNWTLRVDLENFDGNKAHAEYESFDVGDAASNYTLNIGSYTGTAGDTLRESDGAQFSTQDRDNDNKGSFNCALIIQGAGWYGVCSHPANLNGPYVDSPNYGWKGIIWHTWNQLRSLKKAEMKIKPVQ